MYSNLDSPPPNSQFRRPWSPAPNDPLPSLIKTRAQQPYSPLGIDEGQDYGRYPTQLRRREASEDSVEALDLADYAHTLQARQYPLNNAHSPPIQSIAMHAMPSRESITSYRTAHTSSSRPPHHRPYSLPPPSHRSNSSRPTTSSHPSQQLSIPPQIHHGSDIDVSKFPPWSRNWYNTPSSSKPVRDPFKSTPSTSSHGGTRLNPFDPGYVHDYTLTSFPNSSTLGHDSNRDLLPWTNDVPPYSQTIDSGVKEERVRMLEREFGQHAQKKKNGPSSDFLDENGKPMIGTVDDRGRLVTPGPKRRMAVRALQVILAGTAAIPAIYAALSIKVQGDQPPPAGKPAAYVLYVLSVITLLILVYLFVFRPCCCAGKRQKPGGPGNPLTNGMMVLPVSSMPGGKGKKDKKNHKGGKKGKHQGGGDVQVNLIVDPNAFGRPGDESSDEDEEDDEYDWEGASVPGSYGTASNKTKAARKKKRARRRSVFAGLAMEERWKTARSWAKKQAAIDALFLVLWGAVFVYILMGKRCPSGAFQGWCNAYNTSSAAACLLCVAFGVSTFFNVQDLHSSAASPRTRA